MKLLDKTLQLLAPHECIICAREGSLLCAWCAPDALPRRPDQCYKCGTLTHYSATCHSCSRASAARYVWIRTDYDGAAKELIQRIKFQHARAAAHTIATAMVDALPYLDETTLITSIPTATSRVRARGYDQSELIARELAHVLARRYVSLLGRVGQTRQVGASRDIRARQIDRAFRVRKRYMLNGVRRVVIVDDVMTTGATVEAAARILKSAGVSDVSAAVFARATPPDIFVALSGQD